MLRLVLLSVMAFFALCSCPVFQCKFPSIAALEAKETTLIEKGLVSSMRLRSLRYGYSPFSMSLQIEGTEGTAFRFTEDGKILTAMHVVENSILIHADIFIYDKVTGVRLE